MGLLGGFGSDKTPKRTRRAIWMPRKALWAPFVVGTPILCWSALDGPKGEMGLMWGLRGQEAGKCMVWDGISWRTAGYWGR